mmetsp:Transcript_10206/g.31405  ORF Transcript_10206/g.31405 Transcript_10206/m.31405 type:complete len:99 (-) Transcript_10206:519-815(-)
MDRALVPLAGRLLPMTVTLVVTTIVVIAATIVVIAITSAVIMIDEIMIVEIVMIVGKSSVVADLNLACSLACSLSLFLPQLFCFRSSLKAGACVLWRR